MTARVLAREGGDVSDDVRLTLITVEWNGPAPGKKLWLLGSEAVVGPTSLLAAADVLEAVADGVDEPAEFIIDDKDTPRVMRTAAFLRTFAKMLPDR
jgi:hypothetical protein